MSKYVLIFILDMKPKRFKRSAEELQVSEKRSSGEEELNARTKSAAVTSFIACETFALESEGNLQSVLDFQIRTLDDAWKCMTIEEGNEYMDRYLEAKATLLEKFEKKFEPREGTSVAEIKRPENKEEVLNTHLQCVAELEKCAPGDVKALEKLLNTGRSTLSNILGMKGMTMAVLGDVLWRTKLEQRLDDETRMAWEFSKKPSEIPTSEDLYQFLDHRVSAMRSIELWKKPAPNQMLFKQELESGNCSFCNEEHQSEACPSYSSWTVATRKQEVGLHRLCFKCLNRGHLASTCRASSCSNCQRSHHETLCPKKVK